MKTKMKISLLIFLGILSAAFYFFYTKEKVPEIKAADKIITNNNQTESVKLTSATSPPLHSINKSHETSAIDLCSQLKSSQLELSDIKRIRQISTFKSSFQNRHLKSNGEIFRLRRFIKDAPATSAIT